MRKLWNKLIFICNSVVALALLLSYLLPYVSPKAFPLLSVLSLAVPVLIVINMLFFLYWGVLLSKRMLLSLIVLVLGISHVFSLYKLNATTIEDTEEDSLSFMSYNVHSFNRFDWIESNTIPEDISAFVKTQDPTVFCMQEYYDNPDIDFTQYPYEYHDYNNDNGEIALVVFSKFPIINSGTLNFKSTANNTIFADIATPTDTIRIYNVHLQSHKLNSKISDMETFDEDDSERMLKSIQGSFKKQQAQTEQVLAHMKTSPYPTVVMGDFNNTAYSYVYNTFISEGLKDSFKEAGKGFGKTFNFEWFPARIDFILVPESATVLSFKNFTLDLSDHYPNYTKITL